MRLQIGLHSLGRFTISLGEGVVRAADGRVWSPMNRRRKHLGGTRDPASLATASIPTLVGDAIMSADRGERRVRIAGLNLLVLGATLAALHALLAACGKYPVGHLLSEDGGPNLEPEAGSSSADGSTGEDGGDASSGDDGTGPVTIPDGADPADRDTARDGQQLPARRSHERRLRDLRGQRRLHAERGLGHRRGRRR